LLCITIELIVNNSCFVSTAWYIQIQLINTNISSAKVSIKSMNSCRITSGWMKYISHASFLKPNRSKNGRKVLQTFSMYAFIYSSYLFCFCKLIHCTVLIDLCLSHICYIWTLSLIYLPNHYSSYESASYIYCEAVSLLLPRYGKLYIATVLVHNLPRCKFLNVVITLSSLASNHPCSI